MSQENVELARRFSEANRTFLERVTAGEDIGEASEWWAFWDPEAVIVEIHRWIQGWLDAFDEISVEPHDFTPVGDSVVVSTRQRFHSKAGVDVEQDITQVLRFCGGKMTYATGYRDRAEALEAAGLRE